MNSLYVLLWAFLFYSFFGWCCEVVFAASVLGYFSNRGFLNGPYCPLYGFGVVGVILCLSPIKDNLLLLFAGSVALTSLLELIAGFALEKMFRVKWWDYSDKPYNLSGYICLAFSLLWGLGSVFVLKLIHPAVLTLIALIPPPLGYVLLPILYALFLTDAAVTVILLRSMHRHFSRLEKLSDSIRKLSDAIGENLSDGTIAAREANEKLKAALEERKRALEEMIHKLPKPLLPLYKRLRLAFPKLREHKIFKPLEKFLRKKR